MKASIYYDTIPTPKYPHQVDQLRKNLTAREMVNGHILDWTKKQRAPLFVRVPFENRGQPTTFISHAWDAEMLAFGYGTMYAISEFLNHQEFIWMDIFCHNQHHVGSIAPQMETVISKIDRIILPVIDQHGR